MKMNNNEKKMAMNPDIPENMKQEDKTPGIITETDENGKPIAGRYEWEKADGKIQYPRLERKAEMLAIAKTVAWIKDHPRYTMEEVTAQKRIFLKEARDEIREKMVELVARKKAEGESNEQIARELEISESTVRAYAPKNDIPSEDAHE